MPLATDAVLGTPSRRSAALVAIVGFSVLAAVTATRSRPPRGFQSGGQVAWSGATNRTADQRLTSAALGALDVALGQSGMVRLATDSVRGERFRLELLIDAAGDGVRLRATVRDETGRPIDSVGAAGEFLPTVDRLADQIRKAFGERRTERDRSSIPVSRLGSRSIDALAAYGEGLAALARHDDPGILAAGRLAIAADSGFAEPWLLAGHAALRTGLPEAPAWVARGAALRGRGRRSE